MQQGEKRSSLMARAEALAESITSKYVDMSRKEIRSILSELEKDIERLVGSYK